MKSRKKQSRKRQSNICPLPNTNPIPNVGDKIVGYVDIRSFDQGVMTTLNAIYGGQAVNSIPAPCYSLAIPMPDGTTRYVPAYFDGPEPIYQQKVMPFVTVHREDPVLAMHRWMGVGQLEYRAGVSGTQASVSGSDGIICGFSSYQSQIQAFPYDIGYTYLLH